MLTDHAHIPRRGEASGGCWGCSCWQPLRGGEKRFALIKLVQFKETCNQTCYSPIFLISRPWSTVVGGDRGRKNGLISFRAEFKLTGQPVNRLWRVRVWQGLDKPNPYPYPRPTRGTYPRVSQTRANPYPLVFFCPLTSISHLQLTRVAHQKYCTITTDRSQGMTYDSNCSLG